MSAGFFSLAEVGAMGERHQLESGGFMSKSEFGIPELSRNPSAPTEIADVGCSTPTHLTLTESLHINDNGPGSVILI